MLLAADAKVELVASGFGLNEGTTWVRDGKGSGFLLVGGLLDNVLYKITPDNSVSVFMEKAGYTGTDVDNVSAPPNVPVSPPILPPKGSVVPNRPAPVVSGVVVITMGATTGSVAVVVVEFVVEFVVVDDTNCNAVGGRISGLTVSTPSMKLTV